MSANNEVVVPSCRRRARPDFHAIAYAGLTRAELYRTGSVVLHEYWLDALGSNGRASGPIYVAYVDAFMANLDWEVVDARYRATLL